MLNLDQYDIVAQLDLADASYDHTSVYKLFDAHWQERFNHNQRIVFYTSRPPPKKLLEHIERAAHVIDISECFILICCPFELSTSLQSMVVEVEETKVFEDNYAIPDSICPIPWSHIEVDIAGNYKPCCVYSESIQKSVRDSTIDEAFNSDYMNKLRDDFLQGVKPSGCSHCWKTEDNNLTSNRIRHLNFLQKKLFVNYLDNVKIRSIDVKCGNTCNFKCRICNPDRSSLIAAEIIKTYPEKTFKIKNMLTKNKWTDDDTITFFDDLEHALPDLENIDMMGGETFLVKKFDRIVEAAVKNGHSSHIRLHYNSNGSIFPNNQTKLWDKFKQVDLALSIDNTGEQFELERGGSWQDVKNNIKKFLELNLPNLNVYVMPTINIQNVFYMPELLEWASSLKLTVVFNYLEFPKAFNIDYLTTECKQLVVEKYKKYNHPELDAIAIRIENSTGSDGTWFVDEVTRLDNIRNQSFQKTHPEVAKAMGYVYNKTL
jgi:hypothetical protein